jgi:hypothetical protein
MSTNAQIASVLAESAEAHELAKVHDVHTLMGKLKEWYESVYGKIAADFADWHWHATTLKNQVTGETVIGGSDADKSSPAADGAGSGPQPEPAGDAGEPPAAAPVDETLASPAESAAEPIAPAA